MEYGKSDLNKFSSKKRAAIDEVGEDDDEIDNDYDYDSDHETGSCFNSKKFKRNQSLRIDQYRRAYFKSSSASTHTKHKSVI